MHYAISSDYVVSFLNLMLLKDPEFVNRLFLMRTSCPDEFESEGMQVSIEDGDACSMGVLNVLNSLFGTTIDGKFQIDVERDVDSIKRFVANEVF